MRSMVESARQAHCPTPQSPFSRRRPRLRPNPMTIGTQRELVQPAETDFCWLPAFAGMGLGPGLRRENGGLKARWDERGGGASERTRSKKPKRRAGRGEEKRERKK